MRNNFNHIVQKLCDFSAGGKCNYAENTRLLYFLFSLLGYLLQEFIDKLILNLFVCSNYVVFDVFVTINNTLAHCIKSLHYYLLCLSSF